ncbi:MAG: hypothetical protein AAF581_14740 [Planctomycetota bacterium]
MFRKFALMLCLVACFGLTVTGCSKDETPSVDDVKKSGEKMAEDGKKAADDAKKTAETMKKG